MTNIPFSPAFNPSPDLLASVPVHVAALFDFSDWQATHPTEPLPGVQVDACFAQTNDALNNVMDRLAMIQRDDGALANASVGFDQMDPAILAAIDADVADAAAAAAAAEAAQAAAEASQAAAEAALAEATAATDAAEAAQAAAAASAAEAAASVDQVIPLVEDAQQAAADAAAAAAAVEGLIPALPATPDDVIVVNPTGDDYELRRALVLLDGNHFDANNNPIQNVALPTNDNDAANKAFVISSISAAGSVPAPSPADDGKVLTATGGGLFGWVAFVVDQISNATAFMKGLLTTVVDAAGFRAAIDVPSTGQVAAAVAGTQPLDATLTALAALNGAANQTLYFTGPDAFALTGLSAYARTLLDDADVATARGTLGLGTAAVLNAGVAANNAVQLDGAAKLPAVDGSQLINVRSRLARILVLTASTTYEQPANLDYIVVDVQAGGAAGGGAGATAAGQGSAGSGGSAGGYSRKRIAAANLLASEVVSIGAGGTGVVGSAGNPGGTSSFGALCSASGGTGGLFGATSAALSTSGRAGGGASGGELNLLGGSTECGFTVNGVSSGSCGGDAMLGRGGAGTAGSSNGQPGVNYGGGGGGGVNGPSQATNRAGGNGAQGVVIIYEFVK